MSIYSNQFATVDMEKIFNKYYKTLRFDKKLAEHKRYLDEQFKYKVTKARSLEKELQKLNLDVTSPLLTATMKREKSRQLEKKNEQFKRLTAELKNFQNIATKQLQENIKSGRLDILKSIRKVISSYAEKKGYSFVLDSSSNAGGGSLSRVVYSKKTLEITSEILAILNDSHEEEVLRLQKAKQQRISRQKQKQNLAR